MPTASDMVRLGSMLISGHRQRNAEVSGLGVETREFVGDLHDLTRARRRDVRRHAAQTGRFVGELHDKSRARRGEMQEHAAETGQFVGQLHDQSRARRGETQEHAADTGRFVHELHDQTGERKADNQATMRQLRNQDRARMREVQRHAAQTADFVGYLHGVTRERKQEVAELISEAQQFMAGLAAITRGGRNEWRRRRAATESARKTATGAGRRAAARARSLGAEGEVGSAGPVLAYVAEHPGARLTEIEEALRINRIEAARTVRALLGEGRVRRDEETREYFPV